jgi:DNA-binding transcriptional MerR regulator/methylmalonyl-CoA mutase cobalamin-binding subunit
MANEFVHKCFILAILLHITHRIEARQQLSLAIIKRIVTIMSKFMADAHHAIKAVSLRTGLTAHVIRVWEKRYGAVEPARTNTNRRLYSDEQIERLSLLRDVTQGGHSIGHVAKLPTEKLRKLADESAGANGHKARSLTGKAAANPFLDQCIAAVETFDSRALDAALKRGETELGAQGLLQRVIAPLAQMLGELWRDGSLTAAHEHFATAVVRVFLGHAAKPFAGVEGAPALVVATPAGQIHELGALLAGAAATNLGWHVTYLGASLPAAEIAGAAQQNRARAVALSLVYPEDDSRLEGELSRLRERLPPEIMLLVGGRAMPAYRDTLAKIGALQIKDLDQLCSTLDNLRKPAKALAQ